MGKADGESPTAPAWLKHLLLQLADCAMADAAELSQQPEEALHRLRLRMKKAGALLRLGESAIDEDACGHLRDQMRRIKDLCASRRDAFVIAELAEELGKKHGLHLASPSEAVPLPKVAKLRSLLANLRRGLSAQPFDGLTWDDVQEGYARCYKTGRKRMRRAGKSDLAADFHHWRKRVKALHFQMQILHGGVPHLRKRLLRTQKLGHLLGCDHDLTLLDAQTKAQSPSSPWQEVIEKHRKKLRKRIQKLGEEIYQQSTHRFARLRRLPD